MNSDKDARSNEQAKKVVTCDDITFDLKGRVVTLRGRRVNLSEAYLNALFLLVERSPSAVPKEELALASGTTQNTLYKVIETLRKALEDTEHPRRLIVTERGIGYRFLPESAAQPNIARVPAKSTSLNHNRHWLVLGLLLILASVMVGSMPVRHLDARPVAMLKADGPTIIASDASGNEVWRHFFEGGLSTDLYTPSAISQQFWTGNLSGGDGADVVFIYNPLIRGAAPQTHESSSVFCFSPTGQVKWVFRVGRAVRDSGGEILARYNVLTMLVMRSQDPRPQSRIIVASGHSTDQACQLAFLDAEGHLVAEYWHPGDLFWLRTVHSGPSGAPRVLAAGVNNGEHRATIVELDPFAMHGLSTPSQMQDQRFRLLDMPQAHENSVILFPRTCLSRNEPYTRVSRFAADDRGVEVVVTESYNPASKRVVFYDFDPALRLRRAFISSDFREEHLRLEESGAIRHSWREDDAGLAKGVEYRRPVP